MSTESVKHCIDQPFDDACYLSYDKYEDNSSSIYASKTSDSAAHATDLPLSGMTIANPATLSAMF
jgi:hypothetical protein